MVSKHCACSAESGNTYNVWLRAKSVCVQWRTHKVNFLIRESCPPSSYHIRITVPLDRVEVNVATKMNQEKQQDDDGKRRLLGHVCFLYATLWSMITPGNTLDMKAYTSLRNFILWMLISTYNNKRVTVQYILYIKYTTTSTCPCPCSIYSESLYFCLHFFTKGVFSTGVASKFQ